MSEEEKRTRPLERFGWFAASHVAISIETFFVAILILLIGSGPSMPQNPLFLCLLGVELLSMACYWGAGAHLARSRKWTAFSSPKEFWGAMLRPAVIAWIWGGALLTLTMGVSFVPDGTPATVGAIWGAAVAVLFFGSMFLCAPSSLMVYLWFVVGVSQTWPGWSMWVMLLLAGGLPPLLFTLGSAWGSGSKDKRPKGPLLTGGALVVALGLFFIIGISTGQGFGFGPGVQDWRYEMTGGYQLMRVNTCTIVLTEEDGEIVVDGYVSAFIDTGKDIFVRGVPEALDDPDDRPEMDMCLWYWIDTEKEVTYGPYESAQALEEAADAQGVYVPAPESWTETYPAPSGARYD